MPALELPRLTLVWPTKPLVDPPVTTLSISAVLSAWRAAERELGAVPAGSPEWPAIHTKLVKLRATYHRLVDERCDRGNQEHEARMTGLRGYVTGLDRLGLVSR